MKRSIICLIVLFFLAGAAHPAAAEPDLPLWTATSHYIVFEKGSTGPVTPFYHTLVEMAGPLESLSPAELDAALAEPERSESRISVTLSNYEGTIFFQGVVDIPNWLRGEFHSELIRDTMEEPIDGHFIELDVSSFVARVPMIPATILELRDVHDLVIGTFDMDSLPLDRSTAPGATVKSLNDRATGNPMNRIDFLIMGDGYTNTQATTFNAHATNLASNFFNITPLYQYQNYFNVVTLFTPSTQSGADHPPYSSACGPNDPTCCGDPSMLSDPLQGTMVSTAFDARYCAYYIHRLLVVDVNKIYVAAAAYPDWDTVLVIVNDSTYGGSGGIVSVVSTTAQAVSIAQHEFGHSFAGLADEYDSAYPGYPPCSDTSGFTPCEDNVTNQTNPALIKWRDWILPITPTPTIPEWSSTYAGVVGLFEGARYLTTGMFRPGQQCLMYSLGKPFCAVPSQSFVLTYYNGGWGNPWFGISMIEPGTTNPPSPFLVLPKGASMLFAANILSPVNDVPPAITWYLDSALVINSTNSFLLNTTTISPGTHTIMLEVIDQTALVHPNMAGTALRSTHVWTVEVRAQTYLPMIIR